VSLNTKAELLRRAADLVGRDQLAVRLKVPASLLDAWISGTATMPDRRLTALADILDRLANQECGKA
jgi:hypothetical protein